MKNTVIIRNMVIILALVFTSLITSCKKESDCFDEALYQEHKDDFCPMDCPGVVGCDGKTYCNECEANKHGIRVK